MALIDFPHLVDAENCRPIDEQDPPPTLVGHGREEGLPARSDCLDRVVERVCSSLDLCRHHRLLALDNCAEQIRLVCEVVIERTARHR